ncbi:uncharacterized protein Z519_08247 [Cladophialophora bantiana CBS 173.52]|uniref:Conidiation protein 6 n=1 Tax=Cladophialophora bantiana (strain ATCC 10958 / CBS 173.52 / CDC B-1940 / NIH 8579) TaxID=1442370 RepID=A0A0D2EMV4_CLAB1|nr:uncharacterized protein Z519_08247 [Cladophialophora bantiana CBS 173.52]KIW91351.1 hypothetical protein Z519_08247 [Cladophialophora bantiana CBS 173.52]
MHRTEPEGTRRESHRIAEGPDLENVKRADSFARTLSNPNTSEEAKQHAREALENEFQDAPHVSDEGGKDPATVARDLKA